MVAANPVVVMVTKANGNLFVKPMIVVWDALIIDLKEVIL